MDGAGPGAIAPAGCRGNEQAVRARQSRAAAFQSVGRNPDAKIYLPEGYQPGDTARYPVIYLLDGSADEDFIHVVGLVQFNTFPWIKRLPKSIVVGIANVDRQRDFTYPTRDAVDEKRYATAGHFDKFITFLEQELQPYINRKYRTNASRTIIGQSLAGLLATEFYLKSRLYSASTSLLVPAFGGMMPRCWR